MGTLHKLRKTFRIPGAARAKAPRSTAEDAPETRRRTMDQALSIELSRRAMAASADFVEQHIGTALIFKSATDIRKFAIDRTLSEGLILEFGVYNAGSINAFGDYLAQRGDPRPIYGFDAFLGLNEDWAGTTHTSRTRFDRGGRPPEVRDNVQLVQGWIDDTLPSFLEQHDGPIAFLHIDTDTFSPCKTVLSLCRDRLVPGSLILFDDLLCYPGWQHGELKALNECLAPERYTWRAFAGWRAVLTIN